MSSLKSVLKIRKIKLFLKFDHLNAYNMLLKNVKFTKVLQLLYKSINKNHIKNIYKRQQNRKVRKNRDKKIQDKMLD